MGRDVVGTFPSLISTRIYIRVEEALKFYSRGILWIPRNWAESETVKTTQRVRKSGKWKEQVWGT